MLSNIKTKNTLDGFSMVFITIDIEFIKVFINFYNTSTTTTTTVMDDIHETSLIEIMTCCVRQASTGEYPVSRSSNRKVSLVSGFTF